MSKIISGKEALIALANGGEVEIKTDVLSPWKKLNQKKIRGLDFYLKDRPNHSDSLRFRLKPRTITINGIEVPAPFEPKEGDMVWCINELSDKGYEARTTYDKDDFIPNIAYWRTEEEIKQVVAALRSVFK